MKIYNFYAELIDEVCSLFQCEYIHIGGDELYFNDLPQYNYLCHWDECKICKKKMKENNLHDIQELYYYLINRMNQIAAARNKKIIVYNDELDSSKDILIDKNITVQFWRVANKNRGPRKGCSMSKLTEQGFKVINSVFQVCYIDLEEYANPEKISCFSYKEYPYAKIKENVVGSEICAWDYGNPKNTHYYLSFSCSAALLLEKLWNMENVCYDEDYRRSLTKFIFGCNTPKHYDVTKLFGSVIPPRSNENIKYATLENQLIGEEELLYHKKVFSEMNDTYSMIYKKYIEETLFYDTTSSE